MKKFKVIKIVLSVLLLTGLAGGSFIWYSSRPINDQQAKRNIQSELEKIVENTDNVTQGLILVSSKKT